MKTIQLDDKTHKRISDLAKALRMTRKAFLAELIENVFDVGSGFKTLNIMYTSHFVNGTLHMNFSGRRNIVFGSIRPDKEREAIDEAFKELTKNERN